MPRHGLSRRRLRQIGALILVAGLVLAALIFLAADDEQRDVLGYEFAGGTSYAVPASDSKMYRHELERFGGKAAVFADDLNRWFASLWHGRRLALLVALVALVLAAAFFRAASRRTDTADRQNRPKI
jgi:hypothetical protein